LRSGTEKRQAKANGQLTTDDGQLSLYHGQRTMDYGRSAQTLKLSGPSG